LNKKVLRLARKSAYSYKAKANQIMIVEDFDFEAPKTKEFDNILRLLNLDNKKVLLLTDSTKENIYKSGRNIPKVNIVEAEKASTYDLVNNQVLLIQAGAVEKIEKILN
jgi:large subunit ribosomal protein L4